jgi:hypothetical protein
VALVLAGGNSYRQWFITFETPARSTVSCGDISVKGSLSCSRRTNRFNELNFAPIRLWRGPHVTIPSDCDQFLKFLRMHLKPE